MRIGIQSGVVLLCAALLGPTPLARADARCSLIPRPAMRAAGNTILLGTSLPDTIETGPGAAEVSSGPGHSGRGGTGRIFGQMFDVSRFGGADSASIAGAFERNGNRRVVIVPWDYDPGCQPTRWTRGFAWLPPSEPVVLSIRPRPDSLWVNGVPTLDAFVARFALYPQSFALNASLQRSYPLPWLSAGEYMDVLHAMPAYETLQARPDSAYGAVVAWAASRPDLVDRFPAAYMIDRLRDVAWRAKWNRVLEDIDPLIGGTWRMTIRLDDGPEQELFARTHRRVTGSWPQQYGSAGKDPRDPIERPDAYLIYAISELDFVTFPDGCELPTSQPGGYMYVIDPVDPAVTEWQGWVETGLLRRLFPDDGALQSFARQEFTEWAERHRAGVEREAPARFRLGSDGVLRVEQDLSTSDGRVLRLRGERVSTEMRDC